MNKINITSPIPRIYNGGGGYPNLNNKFYGGDIPWNS